MAYKIKNDNIEVKTKDGKNIFGSDFKVELKEHDAKNRSFLAIASTQNPDRSNDTVHQEGWNLKNYRKAPRGLWMHNMREIPIFRSIETKVNKETQQLIFRPQFDVHDFAQTVYNQYINDFLSDFSVGFIPEEMNYKDEDRPWSGGIDFLKQELLEISSVTIPDNPEAQRMGLFDNNNLLTLGYSNEFEYDEKKGIYWNPISKNLDAYSNPKLFVVGNGIKAVNASPMFQSEIDNTVVGYLFDSSVFSKEDIDNWVKENVKIKPKTKFYSIYVEEGKEEISFEITEEEKSLDEGQDNNTDDNTSDINFDKSNDEVENSVTITIKSISPESIERILNIKEEQVKNLLENFDKFSYSEIVNVITEIKSEMKELKDAVVKLSGLESLSGENDDEIELELDGFSPVSIDDDSDEFEIDPEEIKQVSSEIANSDAFTNTFEGLFQEIVNENSGKID